MNAFRAILAREITLSIATGGAGLSLTFFVLTIALLPLAVGSEPDMLRRLGPGFAWLAALLAQLLTLERLVQADLEDGSLDLLVGAALPLELGFVAKTLAHWLSVGLPLTVLSLFAALLDDLDGPGTLRLVLSLLIGLPGLSAIGGTISALTAGVRRGSLLVALLALPLAVPFLIFGSGAASGRGLGSFLFLGAISVFSLSISLLLGPSALRSQIE
jgi:heme exporter protein B